MILLTQPSIPGAPLLRREVDRLLVVPITEIQTDGVRPSRRGAWRVVITAGAGPLLGRSCGPGPAYSPAVLRGRWAMPRGCTGVKPSTAGGGGSPQGS